MDSDPQAQLQRYLNYLQTDPENLKLIEAVTETHMRLNRNQDTLTLIERGLQIAPHNCNLLFTQASALMADGRPGLAISIFTTAFGRQ